MDSMVFTMQTRPRINDALTVISGHCQMGEGEDEFGRINREECKRTKHDSLFSKWQVLIGPSDWEDFLLGKEGASRYRVHNLPTCPGPGLYELGVAVPRKGLGREVNKLDSDGVVVVYLGQADSVRTRLQRYGRSGAHLNNPNDSGLKIGPGYFEDVFSRGASIVYRWVPMKNKADALKTENRLLNKFDYAWNKGSNGMRRHDDVLGKLNKVASRNFQFPKPVRKLLYFSREPVGIKIKGIKLLPPGNKFSGNADEESYNLFSQVFKFSKSKPRLVLDRHGAGEVYTGVCGVSLGDGSVCRNQPVQGNKRCDEHKWRKTYGSSSNSVGTSQALPSVFIDSSTSDALKCDKTKPGRVQPKVFSERQVANLQYDTICGVEIGNGRVCTREPVTGRVRCEEHKGLKVDGLISKPATKDKLNGDDSDALKCDKTKPERVQPKVFSERPVVNLQYGTLCGVEIGNGRVCTREPVTGRVRCEEHKGLKIDGLICKPATKDKLNGDDKCSNFSTHNDMKYCNSVCGALTLSGSYCKRPVKGNARCWQHSVCASDMRLTISSYYDKKSGGTSVCGAPTRNGSYCRRTVNGGGTCWQH
ncbi:hypothetical protein Pint_13364 [Pistacia integerrima]|uniref:Uncharacterized protein n=1 Tax=Pistacia integerrima TaxID=434235 RepID=A0ACC0Y7V2_9ROSI|nr:hypothetical protein Pint_13364 [Pistacia integerrima]